MPWIARGLSDPLPDAFAGRGIAPLDALRSDWHAAGWRSRLLLAKDHLLPPREYVRARFGGRRGWTLPLAYARRILSGAPRWLTRSPRAR